jgi:hypothetical protein
VPQVRISPLPLTAQLFYQRSPAFFFWHTANLENKWLTCRFVMCPQLGFVVYFWGVRRFVARGTCVHVERVCSKVVVKKFYYDVWHARLCGLILEFACVMVKN